LRRSTSRKVSLFSPRYAFYFQQAAEKYLKAYIVAHELEFRKIHELPLLLKICTSRDPSFNQLQDDCEFLTTYYIETRYPVHWPTNFSAEQTQKAFQFASQIRALVKEKLGPVLTVSTNNE